MAAEKGKTAAETETERRVEQKSSLNFFKCTRLFTYIQITYFIALLLLLYFS